MQNVNIELKEFFRAEGTHFGLNPYVFDFLDQTTDWEAKKGAAASLLKEIAERIGKGTIYEILLPSNLKIYEEAVKKTLPAHRDHFVHTAYVYLLGLYIWKKNKGFSDCLQEAFQYNQPRGKSDTKKQEADFEDIFGLRWAITALFHDAGYPMEIAAKQMNEYLTSVEWNKVDDNNPMQFGLTHFREAYSFEYLVFPDPLLTIGKDATRHAAQYIITDNVFDMIAYNLACKYVDFSYQTIRDMIISRFQTQMQTGFLNHGIVGSIVLANMAHNLYKTNNWDPEEFYCHFGDCLGAIVLHTREKWMPAPFIKKIDMYKHPIAWLLKLCDELQEWLRPSGDELQADIDLLSLDDFKIGFNNDRIDLFYNDYESTKKIIEKLSYNLNPFNHMIPVNKIL